MSDLLALLREHLEHTGTALHCIEKGEELAPRLAAILEGLDVHNVLVFQEEVPGGRALQRYWGIVERGHLPFSVCFVPGDVPQGTPEFTKAVSECDACITGCRYLIAAGGICVFDSSSPSGRLASLLPPHHIAVAQKNNLIADLRELIERAGLWRGSSTIFVSGPSRTADIEKELVIGVHGPLTLSVVLVP